MTRCERCKAEAEGELKDHSKPFDYCANCGKELCPKCMEAGCCGKKPADSGISADYGDDINEEPTP